MGLIPSLIFLDEFSHRFNINITKTCIEPNRMSAQDPDPDRVLGEAEIELLDVATLVASMRPWESVRIRPGKLRRRVPVLEVEDDSWRAGLSR